jgi:hypothetical protein
MLAHSSPLPLVIFYNDGDRDMTAEDEEGALLALSHRDHVRGIAFKLPAPKLGKFITAMDEQFPILEHLYIKSRTREETSLILPPTFQALNLLHIDLRYAALPMRSLLLTSTGGLVVLWLPPKLYTPTAFAHAPAGVAGDQVPLPYPQP